MSTIGWIGAGIMGRSMCGHVIDAGYEVRIHTRTRSKADELLNRGAVWCETPAEVSRGCSVVFSIVGYPSEVEEVYFADSGILETLEPGAVCVDCTTSTPSLARRIGEAAREQGASAVDAPVSGGDLGAQGGTLAVMAGGDEQAFRKALPLLETFGKNVRRLGPCGAGQHTKMTNQILVAAGMIGVVEALLYAGRAGLDLEQVIDVVGTGAAGSWAINNLGRRIARKDFSPGFFIKYFVKDLGIALEEARRMNLALPGLAMAQQFYISAMARGLEHHGTQGLFEVFDELNRRPS